MFNMILDAAVNTGDSGGMKYIIIGGGCIVAIAVIAILGIVSKKDKEDEEDK